MTLTTVGGQLFPLVVVLGDIHNHAMKYQDNDLVKMEYKKSKI